MRKYFGVAAMFAVLTLAGCQRTAMTDIDTTYRPQPLEAQPVGPVESNQLPDPTMGASGFPEKPVVNSETGQQNTEVAAANALEVKKETMVGGWKVTYAGAGCDMFLTLTNLGAGSRGGTRGCVGELTAMAAWEVSGKQILLKDRDGNVVGRLYKTAETRFDGSTGSGQPITLSR